MSQTRVPAIPSPTDANLREVARAVKGLLDVREGLIGDPLDKSVTLRDLVNGGIANVSLTSRGGASASSVITSAVSTANTGYDPTADMNPPPAPTNFTVTGLFAAIQLSWDIPPITNYAYTEVWRASNNVIGDAVRIAAVSSSIYADTVGNSQTYYYWIRHVSQADVIGPYNGTLGVQGQSAQDSSLLLDLLTNQITETQLYSTLGARINLIDGLATLPGSVNARIQVEANARDLADSVIEGSIAQEAVGRQNADAALSSLQTTLSAAVRGTIEGLRTEQNTRSVADSAIEAALAATGAAVGQNSASITAEQQQRVDADASIATTTNTLAASQAGTAAALQTEQRVRADADAATAGQTTTLVAVTTATASALTVEQATRASGDSAAASQITTLAAKTSATESAIGVEQQVRADADSATASQINSISAATAGNASAIKLEQQARADSDSATASQLEAISAATGDNLSAITTEQQVRTDADSAAAQKITTLGASVGSALSGVVTEQQVRADADSASAKTISGLVATVGANIAGIKTEQDARVDGDAATASQTTIIASALGANTAAIQSEATTRAGEDSALASQITSLSVSLDGKASVGAVNSLQLQVDTIDGVVVAQGQQIATLAAQQSTDAGDLLGQLQIEELVRTAETEALAQQTTTLFAAVGDNAAAIEEERVVRAAADLAQAQVSTTLQARLDTKGSGAALNADPAFSSEASWQSFSGPLPAFVTITDGDVGTTAARSTAGVQSWFHERVRIPVDPTKSYRVRGRLRTVSGTTSTAYLGVALFDSAGANISGDGSQWYYAASGVTPGASWTSYNGDFGAGTAKTFPANARTMTPLAILSYGGGSAVHEVQDLRIEDSTDVRTLNAAITQEAQARTDADAAEASLRVALAATVATGDSSNAAALVTEQNTRATADSAQSSTSTTLATAVGANASALVTQAQVSSTADSSTASQVTTLAASTANTSAGLTTEQSVRAAQDSAQSTVVSGLAAAVGGNSAGILSEQQVRATSDSAAAARLDTLASVTGANAAAITVEATTRTTQDASLASQITTLSTTSGQNSASLQTLATTVAGPDGATAQYTVKTDVNGYVAGFGLSSTANNAAPTSTFIVRADSFAVASPTGPGITPVTPFVVQTTPTSIDGVRVEPGVYMDAAFIKDGTISSAKIANAAIDDAKIAELSANKVSAGVMSVGSFIVSDSFRSGYSGWYIDGDGNAEFDAAVIRGKLTANQIAAGAISAEKIAAGAVTADKIAAGSITASKILVSGQGPAINDDPNTQDVTAWKSGTFSIVAETTSPTGSALAITSASYATELVRSFPIDPAKNYLIRLKGKRVTGTATFYAYIEYYNAAGSSAGFTLITSATHVALPTSWTEFTRTVGASEPLSTYQIPATTVSAKIVIVANSSGTSGEQRFTQIQVIERADASLIVDGAITANKILAGSVTISRFLVSPVSMCPDPYFTDEVWWTATLFDANGWYFESNALIQVSKHVALWSGSAIPPGTDRKHVWSGAVPAPAVGATVRLRARVNNQSNQTCYVAARIYDRVGTTLSDVQITSTSQSFLQDLSVQAVVPANAATVKFLIYNAGGTTFSGAVQVSAVMFDTAASADLIVDGSISADKIAANAITAAKINAAAITTAKISGGAVSAVYNYNRYLTADNGSDTYAYNITLDDYAVLHCLLTFQVYSSGYSSDDLSFVTAQVDGSDYGYSESTTGTAILSAKCITNRVYLGPGAHSIGHRVTWNNVAGGGARMTQLILVTYR
jgi:Domain of unknown function (DUF1983)